MEGRCVGIKAQPPCPLPAPCPMKREKNIFFLEECIHNGVVLGLQLAGPLGTILNSLGKILKPAS